MDPRAWRAPGGGFDEFALDPESKFIVVPPDLGAGVGGLEMKGPLAGEALVLRLYSHVPVRA